MGDSAPRTLEVFSDCVTVMLKDGLLTREERRLISALSRNLNLKDGEPLQVYEKVKIGKKMDGGELISREQQLKIYQSLFEIALVGSLSKDEWRILVFLRQEFGIGDLEHKKIEAELQKLNLKITLHSDIRKKFDKTDIYIVDTFGETKKFHKISPSVFLGKSIIRGGGQNPLEAARYGARILHGPNTDNFKDVYKLLKDFKISKQINTPTQLASSIIFKKNKHSGSRIKNIGDKILKKTIKELDNLFNNEFKKT